MAHASRPSIVSMTDSRCVTASLTDAVVGASISSLEGSRHVMDSSLSIVTDDEISPVGVCSSATASPTNDPAGASISPNNQCISTTMFMPLLPDGAYGDDAATSSACDVSEPAVDVPAIEADDYRLHHELAGMMGCFHGKRRRL